jgi:dolichyl-diphosphooligosaccharide---protein glycosyltransferase
MDRVSLNDLVIWTFLAIALGLVVVVRTWVPYGDVVRNSDVVLVGNDPHFFRYWTEELLASGVDPSSEALATLPEEIREHRTVLFILTMWGITELFGGSTHTAGLVLAWYPVIAAVVMAGLVYVLASDVTGNRFVAVVAVVLLALIPAHAYRTMFGFGDHDAFHTLWVVVMAGALIRLVTIKTVDQPWKHVGYWIAIGGLSLAIAALSFAWRGGTMLLVPIAVFALGSTISCIQNDLSPVRKNVGLLSALVIASIISVLVHLEVGWAEPYRGFAPTLLLVLVAGILTTGELAWRLKLPRVIGFGGVLSIISVWFAGIWMGIEEFAAPMHRSVEYFRQFPREPDYQIGETVSLIADPQTPLMMFGLTLIIALPVMIWVVLNLRSMYRPEWIALSAFAWTFLTLSVVQLRFTNVLAIFTAVFAAVGVWYIVGEMTPSLSLSLFTDQQQDSPVESTITVWESVRTAGIVLIIILLVTGIGVAQIPGTMDRIAVDDTTYETATWISEYSAEQELEHPENYVFSDWGTNRAYNHIVSGEAESYAYAEQNYREFITSSNDEWWYDELDGRTGFIVVQDTQFEYPSHSMQVRLNDHYGSDSDTTEGVENYRLVYVSDDETTKVFTLVPGATISGNATPNSTVDIETDVTVGDTDFVYERTSQVSNSGEYEVTVPYAGSYTIDSEPVHISEQNVTNGDTIPLNETAS